MERISGLVWETERPLLDSVRSSPKFWLLGYEWNFSLQLIHYSSAKDVYKMTLRRLTAERFLGSLLTVKVYISSPHRDTSLYSITRSYDAEVRVWECLVDSADTVLGSEMHRGKWTITFIFDSDQPLMLNVLKNNTELASSQSDTNPQLRSARDAKNLSKAVLSEDKCVQACSDIPPDLESLSSDLRQLLEREIFPDVNLRCGDRNTSAHRSMLAARSEVFAAMFRNKMAESETGTVDVTDVDSEVLDLLLQYVYTGKIPDLSDDTACSLYEAGDKYSIHALKKASSDWMVRNLTAENCLGYLVVADAHSDEDFKERVVDFVAESLKSIKKDAWSKFNKDHGELANRVYQKDCRKFCGYQFIFACLFFEIILNDSASRGLLQTP